MNLSDIYETFPTRQDCLEYLEVIRWNGDPVCPYCGSKNKSVFKNELRYHCNTCNTSYSVTTKTMFNKTKCDLQKWFFLISFVLKGESDTLRSLSDKLSLTKDTVSFIISRIKTDIESDGLSQKISEENL